MKRFLTLLLCLVLTLGLVSCTLPEIPGPGGSTSGTTTGTTPGGGGNPVEPGNTVFGPGGTVEGAGDKLAAGCFALTEHPVNDAGAEESTATAVLNLFRGTGPAAGTVYKITDGKSLTFTGTSDKSFDCGGAVIIAPNGIALNGCRNLTFKNLTVVGAVTATDSESITFENVDIQSTGDGLIFAGTAVEDLLVKSCRIVATGTALKSAADSTTVIESYLSGATGVETAGDDTTVQNCRIEASVAGIIGTGADYAARENTVAMSSDDATGIELKPGGYCSLIALNVVTGAQSSVKVSEAYNTSVILNSAVRILAEDSISTYICDNALGGRVEVKNNNYLLANGNTYPSDGKNHTALQEGNENTNGDTITDVDNRLEVGADESLLPHTNKELFVGMERKTAVKDVYATSQQDINAYIANQAKTSSVVIVAPGAYSHNGRLNMLAAQSNTTVYAYGVYQEAQTGLGNVINIDGASSVTLKGMHVGYKMQSSGQVYVLEKMGDGKLRVIGGAGMMNDFGNTNTTHFNTTSMGAHRADDFYAWGDTHLKTITKNNDGTMTMTVADNLYNAVDAGDIFTCRYVGSGNRSIAALNSADVRYEDIVLYGNAASLAFYDGKNTTTTTYLRVHNTTRSPDIIDKTTYDRYVALEDQYGVSLDVYEDGEGRYRGALPHIGSIDATHVGQCAVGSTIISCIFENMCDDGTNQKGNHARLAGLVDNGDGTTTVTIKDNYPQINADRGNNYLNSCYPFSEGDRVFIYNAEGRLVCDSVALGDAVKVGTGRHPVINVNYDIREVKVATEDVDFTAIQGYDLSDDSADSSKKVVVDNMNHSSNGASFDNLLVQNVRSRGLLIQSSDVKVTHCTFRNIGMAGVGAQHETIHWGESGVTEHMEIAYCLFDNTGYFDTERDEYAPITIIGMGKSVQEAYLLHRDFDIHHNKIVNRAAKYAVYINSARDVYLHDNDFGVTADDSFRTPSPSVRIHGAMNIELKNNVFSPNMMDITQGVVADLNKNVFGDDVSDKFGSLIEDDIS